MAAVYLDACRVLGRRPMVDEETVLQVGEDPDAYLDQEERYDYDEDPGYASGDTP